MFGFAAWKSLTTLNHAAFSPTSNCSHDMSVRLVLPLAPPPVAPAAALLDDDPLLPHAARAVAPAPAARTPPESWMKPRRVSGRRGGTTFASLRVLSFMAFPQSRWVRCAPFLLPFASSRAFRPKQGGFREVAPRPAETRKFRLITYVESH